MSVLTRNEETILAVLCRLGGRARGPDLYEKTADLTGKKPAYGTLYNSLEYLIRKGYVRSAKGNPLPKRGGKRQSVYTLTLDGRKALLKTRRLHDRIWDGLSEADVKSGDTLE